MHHLLYGSTRLQDLALSGLAVLPGAVRRPMLRGSAWAGRKAVAGLRTPVRLLFHVSHACDATCPHCFLTAPDRTVRGQLSVADVQRIGASMRHRVRLLTLCGGEPTLRRDLVALAAAFHEGRGVDRVSVVTHGGRPERVEAVARGLLDLGIPAVRVQVSIDGVGAEHDRFRGVAGLYDNALDSLRRLARLRAAEPRLDPPQVLTTVGRHNLDQLPAIVAALRPLGVVHELGLYRDAGQGVRDLPATARVGPAEHRDGMSLAGLSPDDLAATLLPLRQQMLADAPAGASRAEQRQDLAFLRRQLHALLTGNAVTRCVARHTDGVLLPDGGVAFCEESAPFANLRDHDLDMAAAWASPGARQRRRQLAGCSCPHPCHLSSSLAFDAGAIEEVVAG